MRALVQRVQRAVVRVVGPSDAADGGGLVGGEVAGSIGEGLCVLVGVTHTDDAATAVKLAEKVWHLRVMADDAGVMNRSLAETGAAALVVSQFTLYGDTRRGRRPSWVDAARPEQAEPLVDAFAARLRDLGAPVATGRFGAHMHLELVNDGPVTVLLEV